MEINATSPIRPDLPSAQLDPRVDIDTTRAAEVVARSEALRDADNLQRINRIVVLMQENRSFDHMLGYLSLPEGEGGRQRGDVEGLESGKAIPGVDDEPVTIRPLADGVFADNPGHSKFRIGQQMADGTMTGFVRDFAEVLESAREKHPNRPHESPDQIMGYHTAATVPVYDLLAEHFTV